MSDEQRVLFVCTGNIFRSMSAEYALRAALGEGSGYVVSSAGTEAVPQRVSSIVTGRLRELGINASGHRQRRVDAELLGQSDLVVAMGLDHQKHLRGAFGYDARLFNEISYGRADGVLDGWEAVPDWENHLAELKVYMLSVVDYIHGAMPHFVRNMDGYLQRAK